MNKKLSELTNDIAPELLEEIEVSESMENEKVSLERIKALAMKGISQEVMESKEEPQLKKKPKAPKRFMRKLIIPLVATISLAVGVVAAAHYNDSLRGVFGNLFPFEEQVQSIEKSMSQNGLTFTAEGAFIDEKNGILVVSFIKEDGTPFEEGTQVVNLRPNIARPGGMGWSTYNKLSEDKKKLVCTVDLSSAQKLYGQEVSLEAKDIMVTRDKEFTSPVDLANLKNTPLTQAWQTYSSSEGLNIKLSEEIERVRLDALSITDKGLEIITSFSDQEGMSNEWMYFSLVDERTNEVYEAIDNAHYWSEEELLNKDYTVFSNIHKEDLPYLKLRVKHQYDEIIFEGNWELSFKLNKNKEVKSKAIYRTMEIGGEKLFISKIELSALGLTVQGNKWPGTHTSINNSYLQMKDGSKIKLDQTGSNSGMGGFNIYFKAEDGMASEHEESTNMAIPNMEAFQFIDIDEVDSIILEGTKITLP